jgi:hypothetical protein
LTSLLIPLVLLLLSIPLVLAVIRANELFLVRWSGTALRVVRGRIPQRLLDDIADVLGPRKGESAPQGVTVRGVVEDQRPRVYVEGEISDHQRQRLRNTIGNWPVAKIRNAPRRR